MKWRLGQDSDTHSRVTTIKALDTIANISTIQMVNTCSTMHCGIELLVSNKSENCRPKPCPMREQEFSPREWPTPLKYQTFDSPSFSDDLTNFKLHVQLRTNQNRIPLGK